MPQTSSPQGAGFWVGVGDFAFSLIRLSVLTALGSLPFAAVMLFVGDPVSSFPTTIGSMILAGPALATLFAAMRDMPAMRLLDSAPTRPRYGEEVAAPWWTVEDDHGLERAYLRTFRALWLRALIVSALTLSISIICIVDAIWAWQFPWGAYVIPAFAVMAIFAALVWPVALTAVTEFPTMRLGTLLLISATAAIRRWYLSLLTAAVGGVYGIAALSQPLLTLVLGTGILLYVVWANSRWMLVPIIESLGASVDNTPTPATIHRS